MFGRTNIRPVKNGLTEAAFSKATCIQFCTVASHSVNSANEKVVEGQPKYEEKFKYASEYLKHTDQDASTLELKEKRVPFS